MGMRAFKDFLIIGHPRCGTGTMSKLFNYCGYDVGHERMGIHGVSSWMYAVNTNRVCFHSIDGKIGRNYFRFKKIIHVVRNPFDAFPSVAHTECRDRPGQFGYKGLVWRSKFTYIPINADVYIQAFYSMMGWHDIIDKQHPDHVIKVENAHKDVPELLGCQPLEKPVIDNTRNHPTMTRDEIRDSLTAELYGALEKLAERYGYNE